MGVVGGLGGGGAAGEVECIRGLGVRREVGRAGEVGEVDEVGEPMNRVKVGEVYSVDFFWTEYESIRLHVIATRPNHGMVVEHYQVFDMGRSGVAVTVPRRAWDNWRQWAHDKTEGIHIDKRMVYLAIGDRAQIGNMSLEEFARLTCDQVEFLTERMTPGMMLVRPSMPTYFVKGSAGFIVPLIFS